MLIDHHMSSRSHAHFSEAPACEVGRLARAFKATAGGQASATVESATKVGETHGARDAHRVFTRFRLALEVPISTLKVEATVDAGPLSLPYLRVTDFLSILLHRYPKLLFGGEPDGKEACATFWKQYQSFHPQHQVFQSFGENDRSRILPVCLHGDKGRTYIKQPILCVSWESLFGLPHDLRARASKCERTRKQAHKRQEHGDKLSWPCGKRAWEQALPELHDDADCPKRRKLDEKADMPHNGRGNTIMTRFLCTCIPAKVFRAHPQAIGAHLEELQRELTELFEVGLKGPQNEVWRLALVGVKGDYEYHLECANFTRSYMNIGHRNDLQFCPECECGAGVNAFDGADVPAWTSTVGQSDPWNSLPVLNRIPFAASHLPTLYRRDAFHTLKYGFLRDMCASCIVWLAKLQYFDHEGDLRNIDARLARAYAFFKLYCLAEGKSATLRKFSRGNFHLGKKGQFPYLGGKGADSIICCQFLEFFSKLNLGAPKHESHKALLAGMLQTVQGALTYVGIYHSHGLFMPRSCARLMLKSGLRLFRGYLWLAQRSNDENMKMFSLRPKVHFFSHFLHDLRIQIERGDERIFNYSSAFNCESNEDFIGRVSRISRRVSPKLASKRTIQVYLLSCKLTFKRAGLLAK